MCSSSDNNNKKHSYFAADKNNNILLTFQPLYINNPFLGAVVLAALFVHDASVGLGCALGGTVAVMAEMVLLN